MSKIEYNKHINEVYAKLEEIANIHRSNQSKFNKVQEKADEQVALAEKIAADAYAADRAAKEAYRIALDSANKAKNPKQIKADEDEIRRLESEIDVKIKIHNEALIKYQKANKKTIEIMKYANPNIAKWTKSVNDLLERIKVLSSKTAKEYELAQKGVINKNKLEVDTHNNQAEINFKEIEKLKKELDELLRKIKEAEEEDARNKQKAQEEEAVAKEWEIKTRVILEKVRKDNRKKIDDLINAARIATIHAKIEADKKAKIDADAAIAAEKKRKELEIKSHMEDHVDKKSKDNLRKKAQELLDKNIELWRGINQPIHADFENMNKNLTDKVDRNVLEMLSKEVQHPYPECVRGENIPEQKGGYKRSSQTGFKQVIQRGGQLQIKNMTNIINLPNVWSKEHHKMFRDLNVLKLLSLNPNVLKEMNFFKGNNSVTRSKTLVLMLFWDIQDLMKVCKELKVDHLESYKNLVKNIEENNQIIKKFVVFSEDNETKKGRSSQFVLTEDLIIFYKDYCDKYITNKYEEFKYQEFFNNDEQKIFSKLITDFKHWNALNENFILLKKNLDVISEEINLKYIAENDEPIKTYIRVRCDTYEKQLYNEYFNIYADPEEKKNNLHKLESIYITGPNTNINVPFYTPKKANDANLECPAVPSNIVLNNDCTVKEIVSYDYGYLYGPFTRVFLPATKNKYISNQCTEIYKAINNNKSPFIICYGPSGSGKTSTAFYNNFTKEDGIVLEVLNNKELGVYEISVSVHELYAVGTKIECNKYTDIIFKKDPKNFENGFVLDNSNNGKSGKYMQNNKNINAGKIEWKDSECFWNIKNGVFNHSRSNKNITKLNDFLITLINDVRMIRPTPNNKDSARSHVIVYCKLVNKNGKFVNLIAADLAGVENKPKCSEEATQKEYLNLKGNETVPYYANGEDLKGIEKICMDRQAEGLFINNSLYGMRKDLENVVKDNQRFSLFSKIPIFNSPCLEYYCNQHSYNCFNLPDINTDTKYENAIFNNIREKIGMDHKLDIFVIGVININRDYNNPPTMPYIDLTFLKLKREQLYTNNKYENKSEEIKNAIYEIKNYYDVEILPVLKRFELSINQLLLDAIYKRYEQLIQFELPLNQVYQILINFINILEEINSTSVLGTLDFMHSMKNSLKTDISCNIFKIQTTDPESVLHDIYRYKNIINFNSTKTLHDVLTSQKAVINYKNASSTIRGGNIGKRISKEKYELLKEYNRLKKMLE